MIQPTYMQKGAIERLTKWSNPKQSGDPTQRMMKIWRSPLQMAIDVNAVLAIVAEATRQPTESTR